MVDESEHLDLSVTIGGASFTGAGEPDRVMAALERFSELVAEYGAAAAPIATDRAPEMMEEGGEAEPEPEPVATPPQESPASKLPLPKFLQRDSIKKKNPEIATAIVVWAADHDGKASITTAEIERLWKGTPLKVPGNLARDVQKAVREGWLNRDGKELTATGYGREAIGLSP